MLLSLLGGYFNVIFDRIFSNIEDLKIFLNIEIIVCSYDHFNINNKFTYDGDKSVIHFTIFRENNLDFE